MSLYHNSGQMSIPNFTFFCIAIDAKKKNSRLTIPSVKKLIFTYYILYQKWINIHKNMKKYKIYRQKIKNQMKNM